MQDLKQRTFQFAVSVGKLIPELLREFNINFNERINELINEGTEILKIIVSSINNTRVRVNSK
jgi:hypothetical protein